MCWEEEISQRRMYPIIQLHFCKHESEIPVLWCSGHLVTMSRVGGERETFSWNLKKETSKEYLSPIEKKNKPSPDFGSITVEDVWYCFLLSGKSSQLVIRLEEATAPIHKANRSQISILHASLIADLARSTIVFTNVFPTCLVCEILLSKALS